ncbi:antimicrobial peptide NK-lysin [Pelmatolapia mariae]|uniref:antimicrobial peptide NK-lysin n=1 Tax=Pelmatolapia mariae TaxID=158779 RepID=UPI002FE5A814
MSPAITIALLLLSTTFVESLKSLKDQTKEHFPQHEKKKGDHNKEKILSDEVFPGSCRTCMTIVSRVQKQIGSDKSKDKIRRLLDGACNKLKFRLLKSACRKILKTVKNKLIDALTNGKSAKTICTNLKLCKATIL